MMSMRQSLVFAFAQKFSILFLRLVSLVVVSRLVAPEGFGIFFAALGIATLGRIAGDFGLQQFIVAGAGGARANERRALGAALVTNGLAAAAILALTMLVPPQLLDERVAFAVQLMLLPYVLSAHAGVSLGVLQREMRFGELYGIAVWSVATGIAVTVALALAGFGYLAPVMGAVAEQTLSSILAIVAHRPRAPSMRGAFRALRFGGVVASIDGLRQAADAIVPLAVGAIAGYAGAGMLGRARNVVQLFDRMLLDAVGFVLLPALAKQQRDGRDLAASESALTIYLAAVCWPFFGLMFVAAPDVIGLLLGPKWHEASRLVQILAVGGMVMPFHALQVQYFIAMGTAGRYLRWAAAIQTGKVVLVVVASFISLEAACLAIIAEPFAKAVVARSVMRAGLPPPDLGFYVGLAKGAVAAALAVTAAVVALAALPPGFGHPVVRIAIAGLAAAPTWLAALVILRHPICNEFDLARSLAFSALGSVRQRIRTATT